MPFRLFFAPNHRPAPRAFFTVVDTPDPDAATLGQRLLQAGDAGLYLEELMTKPSLDGSARIVFGRRLFRFTCAQVACVEETRIPYYFLTDSTLRAAE